MEEILFKSEEPASRSEAAAFLRQFADKVESGTVILRQGGVEKSVVIPQSLVLEIKLEHEVKRKKEKMSLEVELEWRPGEEGHADGVELG